MASRILSSEARNQYVLIYTSIFISGGLVKSCFKTCITVLVFHRRYVAVRVIAIQFSQLYDIHQ